MTMVIIDKARMREIVKRHDCARGNKKPPRYLSKEEVRSWGLLLKSEAKGWGKAFKKLVKE